MSTVLSPRVWITVAETAEILGVSDSRVRQMLGSGEIKGEKFGNTWAIARSEAERVSRIARPKGNPNFGKKDGGPSDGRKRDEK